MARVPQRQSRHFPTFFDYVLLVLLMFLLLAWLWAAPRAEAQPMTIDFDVSTSTGDGQVMTTVTWATNPPAPGATPCTATGAPEWAGPKAGAGMQELTLTQSVTLNLECVWPGDSIATLTWMNPTTNTDESPYTDRGATVIRHRFEADPRADLVGPASELATLLIAPANGGAVQLDPSFTMHTITGLTQTGEQQFAAYACNERAVCSVASNVAAKMFTGTVAVTESVGVTVNPRPGPIFGLDAT